LNQKLIHMNRKTVGMNRPPVFLEFGSGPLDLDISRIANAKM
jgi:hypothetical protein